MIPPDVPGGASAEGQIPSVRLRAPVQVWAPFAFVWMVFAWGVLGIATSPLQGSAGTAVAVPLGLLAALVAFVRYRAMHIAVDNEGVTIRNFLRTESLRWEQVEEVLAVQGLAPVGARSAFSSAASTGFSASSPVRRRPSAAARWPNASACWRCCANTATVTGSASG